jgi:hypothetical protein
MAAVLAGDPQVPTGQTGNVPERWDEEDKNVGVVIPPGSSGSDELAGRVPKAGNIFFLRFVSI